MSGAGIAESGMSARLLLGAVPSAVSPESHSPSSGNAAIFPPEDLLVVVRDSERLVLRFELLFD